MSYHVLARKWRPGNFSELVGQEHVVAAISNALDNNRLHHAYLFTGTRGVGKTTIARIFSKSLNCERGMSSTPCGQCATCQEIENGNFVDLLEIDAASRTKVEDTRELLDNVQYKPTRGEYKVYLIDEVHMLSKHSFNALLKTLEEPPPHVKFLLATTDPQKLPITILSRCLQFNLKALSRTQISEQLSHILAQEGISAEELAIAQLARAAQGSMRDALSLTDQAIAQGNGQVTANVVTDMLGLMDKGQVLKLVHAVLSKDSTALMEQVEALSFQAPDYAQVIAEIMSLFHQIALTQFVPDACKLETVSARAIFQLSKMVSAEQVQLLYQIALQGKKDLPYASDGRAGLEMTLLRMLAFSPTGISLSLESLQKGEVQPSDALPVTPESSPANPPVAQNKPEQSKGLPDSLRAALQGSQQNTPAEAHQDSAPASREEQVAAPQPEEPVATAPAPTTTEQTQGEPSQQDTDFDHQMMAQLEQQQQGIVEQAQDFHPEQFAQASTPVENPVQPEPPVSPGANLSSTESLLALKQRVQQSAKGNEEEESSTSVKKSETGVPDVGLKPVPEALATEQESPAAVEPSLADACTQVLPETSCDNTFEQKTKKQALVSNPAEPEQVESSPENSEQASLPHGQPEPFPSQEDVPPADFMSEDMPFPTAQESSLVPTHPLQVEPAQDNKPVAQNKDPLSPPWDVTSEVKLQTRGKAQVMEEAEEFDPNAHLDEEIEVEVNFDVPVFLESGEKVIAAKQLDTWSHLIEQMQVTALTKQLALHSAYQKVENKVILTLLENKEHLISETAVSQLTQALSSALQQDITLEIKLEQPINTPYAVQQTINRARHEHAHHVVETDEALVNLRNTFSAHVVEGSVKAR